MSDLSREIGGLEARMDEHEKRVDRIEKKIDDGFSAVNARLDKLSAEDSRRKGAWGALVVIGGVLTAVVEGARALFGK
jgi:hypothetical protein